MARPRRQTYTMQQYLNNVQEGYISNNAATQRNPAWKPIIDGLAVTILNDDYIPPLILAEEESGCTVIVDGGSRTAAFRMLCLGNYKIKFAVEDPIIKYKKMEKDEKGQVVWSDAEFDIRNKTFDKFPKELQKKFYEYQIETVIHECDSETVAKYLRRYNVHTGMNANEKMFIHLPKFAEKIKRITNSQFFVNYSSFTDNEKEKGALERVVSESVMCMFHLDKWNKNGKKLATYLNQNATETEFDRLNENIDRLENIVNENTKALFNSKNTFVWLTLFDRFLKLEIDDINFGKFLDAFIGGLRNKTVDGKLFDKADENGSTKDRGIIITKLHILETLMYEFLHINSQEIEEIDEETFIAEVVGLNKEDVHTDFECYIDTLKDLKNNTIRDGSRLLNEENNLSLLAMVAYSYKEDKDLDKWMMDYASKNNTYFADQRKNFYHMKQSYEQWEKRDKVA